MTKLKNKIKLKELQIKEKELDFKIKNTPPRMIRVFYFPCEKGSCEIWLQEGYSREDLLKATKLLKEAIALMPITKEMTMQKKREILGLTN